MLIEGKAMVFNAGVFVFEGSRAGLEFLTGYLIEKALSIDNIFVFIVIFSYFGVPPALQHRVLFWGGWWARWSCARCS